MSTVSDVGAGGIGSGTPRRWVPLTVVLVVVVALAAVVVAILNQRSADPDVRPLAVDATGTATTEATATTRPTASDVPTVAPSVTDAPGMLTVPVYYARDTGTDIVLVREFRRLPDAGGPAVTALTAMLAGEPLDPDYHGLWNPATRLRSVQPHSGEITVDLSAEALTSNVGTQAAQVAVQALVYSVTAALQSAEPVRILIDGSPVQELFGSVLAADPVSRADPLSVRQLVQINTPNEGDVVERTFAVQGEAAVFEANLLWRVERPDGTLVERGFATTAEGMRFAAYSFDLTLDPGEYVVVIEEDDPSDGEGRAPMTDSRAITVR